MDDLTCERKLLEIYLSQHSEVAPKANQLLNQTSVFREYLEPHFKPFSEKVLEWINHPYESNEKYPEYLIHKSISGNTVRSKSEVIIDMALYINKLPYRYESPLCIENITFYPDFTILHPQTGKLYYWEHFGMMDHPAYSKEVFNKLNIYTNNGYIPTINLITTYETRTNPLTSELVEKIIKHYFV